MPSELFVEVCTIDQLNIHPNADRLEIATVKGWQCVVQKDIYKVNDKVVYFPIDSMLPELIEHKVFGEDSKIKLKGSRVRTIRLRKVISQGLVVPISLFDFKDSIEVGTDVKDVLGITKYKTPQNNNPMGQSQPASKREGNSNFSKYTKIDHLSNFPYKFKDKQVLIHEKIHGTNFRCGYITKTPSSIWEHIKSLFSTNREFVYGSHNVQLKNANEGIGFTPSNIYWKTVLKYNLQDIVKSLSTVLGKDVIIYGEVYGDGVQKNYSYGLKHEQNLVVFDIKINEEYISEDCINEICWVHSLPTVPTLAVIGIFNIEYVKQLASGASVLCPEQKVIEGVVVRSTGANRSIAKFINPEYLLKDNSEWS